MNASTSKLKLPLAVMLGLLVWGLASCNNNYNDGRTISVNCAPEVLNEDQWAILSILEITPLGRTPKVRLKISSFETKARLSDIITTSGRTMDNTHNYRYQLFHVRPQQVNQLLLITSNDFENLPPSILVNPLPVSLARP